MKKVLVYFYLLFSHTCSSMLIQYIVASGNSAVVTRRKILINHILISEEDEYDSLFHNTDSQ